MQILNILARILDPSKEMKSKFFEGPVNGSRKGRNEARTPFSNMTFSSETIQEGNLSDSEFLSCLIGILTTASSVLQAKVASILEFLTTFETCREKIISLDIESALDSLFEHKFFNVFYVIDQEGNKVTDKDKIQNLQKVLRVYSSPTSPMGRKFEERSIPAGHTTIELIGNDRPGLISELTAILSDLQCNVVSAEVWTHNTRLAAVMHISDKETKSPIIEPEKLSKIKKVLLIVLKGGHDNREAVITFSYGCTWFDRRLHQIMFADKYYQDGLTLHDKRRRKVDIVSWTDNSYSAISIRCKITPKVLFDTICTLTDLEYFVFRGNFVADGPEAYMEFWIKHIDGSLFKSDAETQKVIQYLETAIERRVYKVSPNNMDFAKVAPTYHLYTPAKVEAVISRL